MLLCLVFILLPATALATCEPDVYWLLFEALDSDKNGEFTPADSDRALNAFDGNLDGVVTVEEMIERSPYLAPQFIGHEHEIVSFADMNNNGKISERDIDTGYELLDIDRNGLLSRAEFENAVDLFCRNFES